MMQAFRAMCLGTALTSALFCATVTETEANGASSNNTFATAQVIPGSAFTTPSPLGVFDPTWRTATINGFGGNSDVDIYSALSGSGPVQIAITDIPFTFSTIISLFDSTGTLLGFSASSAPLKPGSASTNDSYFGTFMVPAAGLYYLAVTSADASTPNFPDTSSCSSFGTLTRPAGGEGGITTSGCSATPFPFFSNAAQPANASAYTLQISVPGVSSVPEPASFSTAGVGLALLIGRWRITRGLARRSAR
jgi:hypothetical protein